MAHTFFCIDGHTCGGPVRLVTGGAPALKGATMSERRVHFIENFDWVRTALRMEQCRNQAVTGQCPELAASALGENALQRFEFRGVSPAIAGEELNLVMRGAHGEYELGAFASDGRQVTKASASV